MSVPLSLGRRRVGPRPASLHDRRLRPQSDQRDRVRLGLHDLQRDDDSLPRLRPLGNEEAFGQQLIQIDPSAPCHRPARRACRAPCTGTAPAPVFYRPGGSGSFDLTATVTDAQSGPQKPNFPNVAGFGAGGDDTTIPFTSPTATPLPGRPARRRSPATTAPTPARPPRHDHRRLDRAERELGLGRGRLLHDRLGRRHARQRLRRRLRPRRGQRRRRARLRDARRDGTCGTFAAPGRRSRSPAAPTRPSPRGNCYRYRYSSPTTSATRRTSAASADAKVDTSRRRPRRASSYGLALLRSPGRRSTTAQARTPATSPSRPLRRDAQSGIAKLSLPDAASGMSGAGDGTTPAPTATPDQPSDRPSRRRHGHERRRPPAARLHGHQGRHRPERPRPPRQRRLYTTALGPADARLRHRRRLRPRRREPVVERDSAPLARRRHLRHLQRLLVDVTLSGGADTTVTSGNCYRYRFRSPTTSATSAASRRQRDAKVDTTAPARPEPQLSARWRTRASPARRSTTAPGRTRLFTVTAHCERRPVRDQRVSFPTLRHPAAAAPARATPAPTATPARPATRPAERPSPSTNGAGTRPRRPVHGHADATAPTGQTPRSPAAPVHDRLGPAHPRQRHRRRLRHRRLDAGRRARLGHALDDGSLRHLQRLLVDRHALRRRRHHRHDRQLLPLPLPISDNVGNRPPRARARPPRSTPTAPSAPALTLESSASPTSPARRSTTTPRARTRQLHRHGTSSDAQSGIEELSFPARGMRAATFPSRAKRSPTGTPSPPRRSGRPNDVTGHERRRPDLRPTFTVTPDGRDRTTAASAPARPARALVHDRVSVPLSSVEAAPASTRSRQTDGSSDPSLDRRHRQRSAVTSSGDDHPTASAPTTSATGGRRRARSIQVDPSAPSLAPRRPRLRSAPT